MSRTSRERALVYDDLRKGAGSPTQQAAFQEMEWRKCAASPEYFIDNYGWLARKGGGIERFILWPIQRMLLQLWEEGTSSVSLKARQLGITTLDVNYKLYKTIFKDANRAFLLSDTQEKAQEAITKMNLTHDRLPQWMKDRASKRLRETENKKAEKSDAATKVKYGFSEFKVLTSTPNSAAGVSGDVTLDEFGRHRQQKRVLDNVLPAYEGGGLFTVIGNGNGEDELFALYTKASTGDFPGMRAFFFWWGDNPERLVGAKARCRPPMPGHGATGAEMAAWTYSKPVPVDVLSLERDQLMSLARDIVSCEEFEAGKGSFCSPWYDNERQKYMRDDPSKDIFAFKQQYPTKVEEAVYIQTAGFIPGRVVNAYSQMAHASGLKPQSGRVERDGEGFAFHRDPRAHVRRYLEPVEGQTYIAGVDPTGDAADGDYAAIKIYRFITDKADIAETAKRYGHDSPPVVEGEPPWEWEPPAQALELAAVYQAKTDPVSFVPVIEKLTGYYNHAFTVIERNNSGGTVIAHIRGSEVDLYREVRHEKFADDQREMIGHLETGGPHGGGRQTLLDNFYAWVTRGWLFCCDHPTISEWSRFGYDEKGKLTAPKGLHDDLLFGDGLAIVGALDLIVNKSDGPAVTFGLEW